MPRIADPPAILCLLTALLFCAGSVAAPPSGDAIEQALRRRIAANSQDGNSWRLLGRAYLDRGQTAEALEALERAVALLPDSAAAQYDLGRALLQSGDMANARHHLQEAIQVAPESTYAAQARQLLEDADGEEALDQVGFEVKSFDGSARSDVVDAVPPLSIAVPPPLTGRLSLGSVFNSNVALAPTSRELTPESPAAVQGFASPELSLSLFRQVDWQAGALLIGYFSLNEGNYREFNLQSYQPGLFAERTVLWGETILTPRVQYDFTHDEFNGVTFGNRHALTVSSFLAWSDRHASYLGWVIDNSNFAEDGPVPSVTSRDGWTNMFTASHTVFVRHRWLNSLRLGVDAQRADTAGSDYEFWGADVFAVADVPLADRWNLRLQGSWGARTYSRFEFTPSRDEQIWRAGAKLRYALTENLSAAAIFNFDRFDSENPLFAARRYVAGAEVTYSF